MVGRVTDNFYKEKKPWSIVKDQLLEHYLMPYFQKILQTKQPTLYIDAFAGKGKFDDGNPGSPIIALNIISKALEKTKIENPTITSCFIELNHAGELKENLIKYENVNVIQGKYEKKLEHLLKDEKPRNVFIYIDPYGVKSLHFSIFDNLASIGLNSIELLINLNSFGFIREACSAMNVRFDIDELDDLIEVEHTKTCCNQKSLHDLNIVAGGSYWQRIINDYKMNLIDGYKAEVLFTEKYCERLMEKFAYVINMPIRIKKGQRPKYRMIYATNHAHGCVLMNDNMVKRWETLKSMQNQGQISFFDEDFENTIINKEQVQQEILYLIKDHTSYIDINTFLAKFICRYGVRVKTSMICNELQDLCNKDLLEVKRTPSLTTITGRTSKFWTTGRNKFVEIRFKV